ncbi:PEPxxWA-CTERM sorting domain-containing protein [Altererythrobacter salegens]|uniref:PEPxxWA-CTERM sorting domain-containing protein n=1 Tax=Croceibacterium salegens TaxID=1737568 RepID=A0A6I4SWG5_9SPHN|nr:PEPxxWA-CTERM sorting domain-containing protein [Croceibacterium salegens]MXO60365.1 PEPxxWA-CTERM sorting domain-containing protein [Croceibacterium salegens]
MKTLKAKLFGAALLGACATFGVSAPANAALTVVSPCDPSLTTPDAIACAGYYSGNLLNGSPTDIANQQAAIATLPGGFTFDGNWSALDPAFKITSLSNVNQLNFGKMLFGPTIIGAHFGNVYGPAGNVSVFWLFDLGKTGASYVSLDHTQGFSNAVLYTTGPGAVPEPSTWALLLVGFGAVGGLMRMRRKQISNVSYA